MDRKACAYLTFFIVILEYLSTDACTPSISGSSSVSIKVGVLRTFNCRYSSCSSNRTISWRINSVTKTSGVNVTYSTSTSSNVTRYNGNSFFTYSPSTPSSSSQNTVKVYCYAGSQNDYVSVSIQYGPAAVPTLNRTGTITLTEYESTPHIACAATCNPACSYTFLKDGSTRFSRIFFISLLSRGDAGNYICRASNGVGSKTSSMNFDLIVQYPPRFELSRYPSSNQVEEGTSVTFTFQPTSRGNPDVYTFQQCNHTTSNRKFLRSISYTNTSSFQVEFSFQNVSLTDGGRYTCAVTNNIPDRIGKTIVTASSYLQIKTPPIILMNTKNVAPSGDGNWTLSVDFISLYYTPEVHWFKIIDDETADLVENMNTDPRDHTMNKDNVSFSIPSYLTRIKTKDPGKYLTFVKNSMGNAVVQYVVTSPVQEDLSSDTGTALIVVGSVFLVLSALVIGVAVFLFYKTRKQKEDVRRVVREKHASLFIPPSIDALSPTSLENEYRDPVGEVNPIEVELEMSPGLQEGQSSLIERKGQKVIKPPGNKFRQQQEQLKDAFYENNEIAPKSTKDKYITIVPPENEQAPYYETPLSLAAQAKKKGKPKVKKDSPYANTDLKKPKETKQYANIKFKGGKTYENHQPGS